MMNTPALSVVIPAYNAGDFIAETLESVFAQTYRPLEIIVVDDGSTDSTAEVVKNYLQRNDNGTNLRYIYQLNSGPSAARNNGIKSSTGKYVAFLDADDLWPEDKLSKQSGLMELNLDVVLTFGDMRRFSKISGMAESMFVRQKYTREFFGDIFYVKDAYKKLLSQNFIPTGTVMIRREYFQNGLFFDEDLKYVEDLDLWLRIAMNEPIAYSTEVWEYKRDHDMNVSNNAEIMFKSLIEVIDKHSRHFHPFLRKNKISLRKHMSDSYLGLGYYYLKCGRPHEAKKAFLKSFHNGMRIKTLFYYFTSFFYRQNSEVTGNN